MRRRVRDNLVAGLLWAACAGALPVDPDGLTFLEFLGLLVEDPDTRGGSGIERDVGADGRDAAPEWLGPLDVYPVEDGAPTDVREVSE